MQSDVSTPANINDTVKGQNVLESNICLSFQIFGAVISSFLVSEYRGLNS